MISIKTYRNAIKKLLYFRKIEEFSKIKILSEKMRLIAEILEINEKESREKIDEY